MNRMAIANGYSIGREKAQKAQNDPQITHPRGIRSALTSEFHGAEDGGRKAEDRGQKTEDRGQRSEDRGRQKERRLED